MQFHAPPVVEYHGSAMPFAHGVLLTFSFDAWRFLDSWLHPRATYRIYAWQRRPLSRPSSRCPWSSAWQLSSTPSTILLSINTKPIPRLGGTAVFLGLVVACIVQILGTWYLGWPPVLVPHPRLHISYPILALSFTVIFATGAIDDVFQLKPKQKLAGQVLAASPAWVACASASSSTRLPPAKSCSDGSPTPSP